MCRIEHSQESYFWLANPQKGNCVQTRHKGRILELHLNTHSAQSASVPGGHSLRIQMQAFCHAKEQQ